MIVTKTDVPNQWCVTALVTEGYDDEPTDDGWKASLYVHCNSEEEAEEEFYNWLAEAGLATHD